MADSMHASSRLAFSDGGAAGTIVVLHSGSIEALSMTLRAVRPARWRELIVAGVSICESHRAQICHIVPDVQFVTSPEVSDAAALNLAIKSSTSEHLLLLNDRLVPRVRTIQEHWLQAGQGADVTIGMQARFLVSEPSPLCHFLERRRLDYDFDGIQDGHAVSGDFFYPQHCRFQRSLWEELGGFSESLPTHYYGADFGRRAYKMGRTIRLLRHTRTMVQERPDLDTCLQRWSSAAIEMITMWERFPDSQVLCQALQVLGQWAKNGRCEALIDRLRDVDVALRKRPRVDLEAIGQLMPLYERVAAYTFAEAALGQPDRLRSLLKPTSAIRHEASQGSPIHV